MSLDTLKPLTDFTKFQAMLQKIKSEIKNERMADTVLISHKSKSWICGRKHKIVYYRNGFKRINSQPAGKQQASALKVSVIDKSLTIACAHCKKDFPRRENGFSSCMNSCNIYMCTKCSICRNHHLLQWFEKMP